MVTADKPIIAMEDRARADDARLFSPSAGRNRDPIRDVLVGLLPETGAALEIGSGTGEHVVHFAKASPGVVWRPSEYDAESLASIAAWIAAENLTNVKPPITLDVTADWGPEAAGPFDMILSCNMIHIAPWAAALGLIKGAGGRLKPGGTLVFYGALKRDGKHTASSNEAFDASLKARDPDWGVRDVAVVEKEANAHGMTLADVVAMPANNCTVVFRKTG